MWPTSNAAPSRAVSDHFGAGALGAPVRLLSGRTDERRRSNASAPHVAYRAVLLAAGLLLFGLLFRQLVTLLLAILITVVVAIPLAAAAGGWSARDPAPGRRAARPARGIGVLD